MTVRPFRISDWPTWRDSFVPPASSHPTNPKDLSEHGFRDKVARERKGMALDLVYALGIFDGRTRQLHGAIDLYVICRLDLQLGHVGYWLHPRSRGQGHATDALRLAAEIAFDDLHLHRLEASISLDNKKSIALAKRAGMIREGIRRSWCWEDDQWADHVVYSFTGSEDKPRVRPRYRDELRRLG